MKKRRPKRSFFVPEVVQTSVIDCGPAAVKSVLQGFGIRASYGRLREACQTEIDGTSIDAVEEVLCQLGVGAVQVLRPVDFLLSTASLAVPSVAVVRKPSGSTHFVVIWRRHGKWLQVMDPETGRRWVRAQSFLRNLYLHEQEIEADAWRIWAGRGESLEVLRDRLGKLGFRPAPAEEIVRRAGKDESWFSLAALEATARMAWELVEVGGLRKGRETLGFVRRTFESMVSSPSDKSRWVPMGYWSVEPREEGRLLWRGALLVRLSGRLEQSVEFDAEEAPRGRLSEEMEQAVRGTERSPEGRLWDLIRRAGDRPLFALAGAGVAAAVGLVIEALALRGFLEISNWVGLAEQRLAALLALVLLLLALLGLELPADQLARRSGRQLESRLRQVFLRKIPRLGDRYFHSRPISDMAERGHSVHLVRGLPNLAHQLVRSLAELSFTTLALLWLAPSLAPWLLTLAFVSVLVPAAHQVFLAELDLRARTHRGALSRFYLDVFLGAVPVRAHRAEMSVRRGHEGLLSEVGRSSLQLHRATLGGLAFQGLLTHGLAAVVVFLHLGSGASSLLLLVYWTLKLPPLGQQLAMMARQVPSLRNVTARLLEPLGAVEESGVEASTGEVENPATVGVALRFDGVAVQLAGREVLRDLDLELHSGEHVAVVGSSGAGKSTLLGLLLGWHQPCQGQVWVDGSRPLSQVQGRLRQETAWIDPSVQLWNRTFLDNLRYGADSRGAMDLGGVLADAALLEVVETLPEGLQSSVGESGKRLSGGEGQRLRLGRGMARSRVRLAILDEPFRGLERDRRQQLLAAARRRFRQATLLIVTHEIEDALELDRVLVIEEGRVVESGEPRALAEREGSSFGALLQARREVREATFQEIPWRRLHLEKGSLEERP